MAKLRVDVRKLLLAVPMAGVLSFAAVHTPFATDRGVANAAAAEQSNCAAVLTSFFGPQGLVDNAVHVLQAQAAQQGTTLGALAVMVGQQQGTLNECLVLVGQPPTTP